ncbi:hypothetical protein ILYODFUR_011544 [Ilyodon furcidens]|uniref:Uncharacterized protein n=1 Tax=Ilyodon furcidens TaxID=33524 RepID=A0ABV0UTC0_9TELE
MTRTGLQQAEDAVHVCCTTICCTSMPQSAVKNTDVGNCLTLSGRPDPRFVLSLYVSPAGLAVREKGDSDWLFCFATAMTTEMTETINYEPTLARHHLYLS